MTAIRTLYRNIANAITSHFARRSARIEHRKAAEHRRKMELAQKTIELMATFASGAVAMMQKKAEIDAAKRKPFNGEGFIHEPGGEPGPNVDVRGWIVKPDTGRIARIMEEEPDFDKAAETWRKLNEEPKPPTT